MVNHGALTGCASFGLRRRFYSATFGVVPGARRTRTGPSRARRCRHGAGREWVDSAAFGVGRGTPRTRTGPSRARRCRHGAGREWVDSAASSSEGHLELGRRCIRDTSNSHGSFSSTALSPRRRTGWVDSAALVVVELAGDTAQSGSRTSHLELARVLLEHGAVATAQDGNGWTPLHWASSGGHLELARVLLEHGAVATAQDGMGRLRCIGRRPRDTSNSRGSFSSTALSPRRRTGNGSTPLHLASSGGHLELARVLLELSPRARQEWVDSAAFGVVRGTPRTRVLLEHGAVATAQDGNGSTPLHWASSGGHVELARVLLEHGAVATAQDRNGSTPLHWASDRGTRRTRTGPSRARRCRHGAGQEWVDSAAFCVVRGTPRTRTGPSRARRCRHGAGRGWVDSAAFGRRLGDTELARVLLEHGAVATAQDGNGSTPLHLASSGGHLELARVLLEHGAVATAQDGNGSTPLHRASSGGHLELARVLLEHGAVATAQDGDGSTPLHFASSRGHLELARVLLEHGAVATAQDGNGSTPLHWASSGDHRTRTGPSRARRCRHGAGREWVDSAAFWRRAGGHVELARVLLEHGAVATAQDGIGSTPLHLASSRGHLELAQVLLEHGAVATAQDGMGRLRCIWRRPGDTRTRTGPPA
jgi:ankyrin repeat protein